VIERQADIPAHMLAPNDLFLSTYAVSVALGIRWFARGPKKKAAP